MELQIAEGDLIMWNGDQENGTFGIVIQYVTKTEYLKVAWSDGTIGIFIKDFENLRLVKNNQLIDLEVKDDKEK